MNFSTFCRRTLLASGLAILGMSSALAADWPRQITDSRGTHTLESQPLRIVSTSVTLTGSLLAIDAPVVASGATTPNNRVADGQGFFAAMERGGESAQAGAPLYRRTER
ncbi:Ferric enterobactin-binding periplasmic protein FepB [Klebsiella grimontii]|uniref:Ferric enterobactin-binding periplasmic protein FepB n=1 Tax=Klebsiella grimontii TaxID=2058152 RepID=A0A7H4P841_9ENTR|nr:Ferric enterobactin-binding periplasmic protein FepB [Klebsiella grimontii]